MIASFSSLLTHRAAEIHLQLPPQHLRSTKKAELRNDESGCIPHNVSCRRLPRLCDNLRLLLEPHPSTADRGDAGTGAPWAASKSFTINSHSAGWNLLQQT
ncbi:uncharacterized protein PV07_07118 [Cladophialophora immunda]|uniref:Uncharacterized protein n=1 Tax=Cladophialophora immunda TaxID=569365 RepID=A0A0D2CAA5_9EURO|nr:uncharacterized protein PV07_07118 [Cladophialophora immunda]KIW27375.1 hypothetical protein PV07_07118 [Cladophialophora immunda]OQV11350.1 hypothetical protein CLAIMM_15196 isoform 1 [Cladophialophora immunda]